MESRGKAPNTKIQAPENIKHQLPAGVRPAYGPMHGRELIGEIDKILEQLQSDLLALLGMKLSREDVVFPGR